MNCFTNNVSCVLHVILSPPKKANILHFIHIILSYSYILFESCCILVAFSQENNKVNIDVVSWKLVEAWVLTTMSLTINTKKEIKTFPIDNLAGNSVTCDYISFVNNCKTKYVLKSRKVTFFLFWQMLLNK